MDRADEYRLRAEEAETRAASATSPMERDAFLKIAEGWRALQRDSERGVKRGR